MDMTPVDMMMMNHLGHGLLLSANQGRKLRAERNIRGCKVTDDSAKPMVVSVISLSSLLQPLDVDSGFVGIDN